MDELRVGLFDEAVEGRFQADIEGNLLLGNRAAAALLGYESPDEMVEKVGQLRRLLCDRDEHDRFLTRLAASGAVSDFRCEVFEARGRTRWISLSAWALLDVEGHPAGMEIVFTDVTLVKLIESTAAAASSSLDTAEAMRAFAQVLQTAVPFEQLTLTVLQGNSYRRIFTYGTQIPQFRVGEVLPLEGDSLERVVQRDSPVIVEDTSERRWPSDGRLAQAGIGSYVILPLHRNRRVFATINLGFSERGAVGERLLELLGSVAEAIAQGVQNALLFEDQKNALEQLRRLEEARNEFIGAVSHDLRSPMAAVVGFAQVLHDGWERSSDDQKRQQVEIIYRTSRQLLGFVNDVLQVAHLESGEFSYNLEPFDIALLVDDIVQSQSDAAHPVQMREQEGLPAVLGDRNRCWQIVTNLIGNACKFSPEGASVDVDIGTCDRFVVVSVSDRGPGISSDKLDRVFDKFSQARSGGDARGAGLGLYICRVMVEAQGGRIWAEARPGGGTTFRFTLPVAS